MRSRMLRAGVWLAVASAVSVAVVLSLPSPVQAQFGLREVPPKTDFFRFKAKYIVKATGEVIQFDLVWPCFAVEARDRSGESIGIFLKRPGGYFNGVERFPKVTSDGHVLAVNIVSGCNGRTTANGGVPADLTPFVTWYDDPNDMTTGWKYATEDAYRSPAATIEFKGASIESASRADFEAWKKEAVNGFRPLGLVRSPYGFDFWQLHDDSVAVACFGVRKLPLPPSVREAAAAAWPDSRPQFWTEDAAVAEKPEAAEKLHDAFFRARRDGVPFGATNYDSYAIAPDAGADSVATESNGAVGKPKLKPAVVFPQTYWPLSPPNLEKSAATHGTIYQEVDISEQRQGMLGCTTHPLDQALAQKFPDFRKRQFAFRLGAVEPLDTRPVNPSDPNRHRRFFERDGTSFWESTSR